MSEVARRNRPIPQQLFGWRRQVRCDPAAGRNGAQSKTAFAIMAKEADNAPGPKQNAPATARTRSGRAMSLAVESPSAGSVPAFAPVVVAMCAASLPSPPPADVRPHRDRDRRRGRLCHWPDRDGDARHGAACYSATICVRSSHLECRAACVPSGGPHDVTRNGAAGAGGDPAGRLQEAGRQ